MEALDESLSYRSSSRHLGGYLQWILATGWSKNPTMEEMRIIHLNGQATSVLLSALDGDEYNRVIGVDVAKKI